MTPYPDIVGPFPPLPPEPEYGDPAPPNPPARKPAKKSGLPRWTGTSSPGPERRKKSGSQKSGSQKSEYARRKTERAAARAEEAKRLRVAASALADRHAGQVADWLGIDEDSARFLIVSEAVRVAAGGVGRALTGASGRKMTVGKIGAGVKIGIRLHG